MMTWDRGPVLPRRLWSPPRRLQPPRGQAQAVLAPPPSLIGSHGTRGGRRRGHSGLGRRPPSGGDERPADSGLGPYGHAAAGPVATAEGGGASGSGGRGEPPGAWACGMGWRSPRGIPHWASRLPGGLPRTRHGRGRASALLAGWVGPGGGAATLSRSVPLRPRLRGDAGAGRCLCRTARRTGPCVPRSVPDPCAASGCARCCSRVTPPRAGAGLGGVGLQG